MKKPFILLTNDDGIDSEGLKYLWESLVDTATLCVAAPMQQQSGAGAGITLNAPMRIETAHNYPGSLAWKIDGKPADCVKLALSTLLKTPPDFVLAGINHGSNAGRNLFYSGTVGAIIEATLRGIPGIALSYACITSSFPHIKPLIPQIIHYLMEHPLPKGTLLNINFPHTADQKIKGYKMARQGLSYFTESPQKTEYPSGHMHYTLGGKFSQHSEHIESDISLLQEGYVTAVPIHIEQLTDNIHFEQKKDIFENSLNKNFNF